MAKNIRHIEDTLNKKKDLSQLAMVATALAFGVGALSSAFVAANVLPTSSVFFFSISLILLCFLLLIRGLLNKLAFEEKFKAKIFFSKGRNVLPIRCYKFSVELDRVLEAVFLESKALENIWNKHPLIKDHEFHSPKKQQSNQSENKPSFIAISKVEFPDDEPLVDSKSVDIIKEAVEFMMLEELSIHLSTYFHEYDNDEYIKEYQRKDVPQFLLENRVFSLLTTPLEQRDVFIDAFPDEDKRPQGEIHAVYGSDGSIYKRFNLILPKGSVIERLEKGGIKIENSRIVLEITVDFKGFTAAIDRDFIQIWLKKSHDTVSAKSLFVTLSGRVKPLSLLASSGWQYYRWLDSYREKSFEFLSFSNFLKEIGWRYVSSLMFAQYRPKSKVEQIETIPTEMQHNNGVESDAANTAAQVTP